MQAWVYMFSTTHTSARILSCLMKGRGRGPVGIVGGVDGFGPVGGVGCFGNVDGAGVWWRWSCWRRYVVLGAAGGEQ